MIKKEEIYDVVGESYKVLESFSNRFDWDFLQQKERQKYIRDYRLLGYSVYLTVCISVNNSWNFLEFKTCQNTKLW